MGATPQWLSISLTFPTGRYHGREWPPAPARLFQALLAGVMTGVYKERLHSAKAALDWLEQQHPPVIIAADADEQPHYRLSVPNNDTDVAGRAWSKGVDIDLARLRSMKNIRPREVAPLEFPHLRYLWRLGPQDQQVAATVTTLSECLHTLGWGIDMAYANACLLDDLEVRQIAGTRWEPTDGAGMLLKVPTQGSLEDYCAAYERFKTRESGGGIDPDTRATVYALQNYRQENEVEHPCAEFLLTSLRDTGSFSREWRDAMVVAAWVRHASGTALEEEGESVRRINEYVHGHAEAGRPREHMSFAPLPTVGLAHNDGRIRRVMVIEPPGTRGELVHLLKYKLTGRSLSDEAGRPVCRLAAPDQANGVWRRYVPRGGARVWRSVTPLVLHGHNSLRGALSVHKTEQLILQAFENSGYAGRVIESVSFQAAPFWAGTGGALTVRTPKHLAKWPRYHIEIRFREPMRGPVLAGIGRHCGIGVFAAAE